MAMVLLFASTASASPKASASVVGGHSQEVRAAIDSFLVPVLPRPVRVWTAPCPGDPSAQGCHTSSRRMDTIWLNPSAGGLDTETVAHEMGHVFESYMWDLHWRDPAGTAFVPRAFRRIAAVLFEDPGPGILYSTAWTENFAESYSACARLPELTETLATGYWGFEMTPSQHDRICPKIDRLGRLHEAATAANPSILGAEALPQRLSP
jgi:hypothetical protein